jgi:hypothetical protein
VQTKLRTDKVADAITPLVTRVANDEELRAHAKTALDSAKTIYSRIQSEGARGAAGRKDVQDEMVKAATELKNTAQRLSAKPRARSHKLRKLVVGAALAAAAVVGLKRMISHDDDEFDYQP